MCDIVDSFITQVLLSSRAKQLIMDAYCNPLLIILFCLINCRETTADLSSNGVDPYQIISVGVPKAKTDKCSSEDSLMVKHTRRLEATYHWKSDLTEKCGYKIKAEPITVTKNKKIVFYNPEVTSRFFLKIYVDHKLLEIVEYSPQVQFDDNVIKNGLFISKVMVYSCEKMDLKYLMKGGKCRLRTYEKQKIYWEDVEDDKKVFVEDWRWRVFDSDECENTSTQTLDVEFAMKHSNSPVVKSLE